MFLGAVKTALHAAPGIVLPDKEKSSRASGISLECRTIDCVIPFDPRYCSHCSSALLDTHIFSFFPYKRRRIVED